MTSPNVGYRDDERGSSRLECDQMWKVRCGAPIVDDLGGRKLRREKTKTFVFIGLLWVIVVVGPSENGKSDLGNGCRDLSEFRLYSFALTSPILREAIQT